MLATVAKFLSSNVTAIKIKELKDAIRKAANEGELDVEIKNITQEQFDWANNNGYECRGYSDGTGRIYWKNAGITENH